MRYDIMHSFLLKLKENNTEVDSRETGKCFDFKKIDSDINTFQRRYAKEDPLKYRCLMMMAI